MSQITARGGVGHRYTGDVMLWPMSDEASNSSRPPRPMTEAPAIVASEDTVRGLDRPIRLSASSLASVAQRRHGHTQQFTADEVAARRRSSSPCSCRPVTRRRRRRNSSTMISYLCSHLWIFEEELLLVLIFERRSSS